MRACTRPVTCTCSDTSSTRRPTTSRWRSPTGSRPWRRATTTASSRSAPTRAGPTVPPGRTPSCTRSRPAACSCSCSGSGAREFLEARCPGSRVRELAHTPAGHAPELWKEIAELGWTGMALPTSHGGSGAGFLELCLVVEEMGRVQLPSPFVPTAVLGALPVARFGSDELAGRLLPGVAAGEEVLSFGWCGSGGAWDLDAVGLTAIRDGDDLVLDGTVLFVPWAGVADHLVLVALDEVRVAVDDVLGDVDGGREVAEWTLARSTAALAAEMGGGAQRVLDMTVEYAGQRQQFGRAIGSFQAVQHHCADMAMDVLGARFAAYEAIWRLGEEQDATTEVSVAKAWVSEAYRRVCATGHQVHGAIGFTEEHDLHLYLGHATDTELAFGDADHHLEAVARSLGL